MICSSSGEAAGRCAFDFAFGESTQESGFESISPLKTAKRKTRLRELL